MAYKEWTGFSFGNTMTVKDKGGWLCSSPVGFIGVLGAPANVERFHIRSALRETMEPLQGSLLDVMKSTRRMIQKNMSIRR